MIWTTRLVSLLALAVSLPLARAKDDDVWNPKILYPKPGTVWHSGDRHNVTWDTSKAPLQITNPFGNITLIKDQHILFDHQLASNFKLEAGRAEIQVPDVSPGSYQLVLFGDSGNWSGLFTIVKH